jgi:hypothetical protein
MIKRTSISTLCVTIAQSANANNIDFSGHNPISNYFWGVILTFLIVNYFIDRSIGRFKKLVIGNLFLFSKDRCTPRSFSDALTIHFKKLKFEIFGHAVFLLICYGFFKFKSLNSNDQAVEAAIVALEFAYPTYLLFKFFMVGNSCPHCNSYYSGKYIDSEFHEESRSFTENDEGKPFFLLDGTKHTDYECLACGSNWTKETLDYEYESIDNKRTNS